MASLLVSRLLCIFIYTEHSQWLLVDGLDHTPVVTVGWCIDFERGAKFECVQFTDLHQPPAVSNHCSLNDMT